MHAGCHAPAQKAAPVPVWPPPGARATAALAGVVAMIIWVVGENFEGLLAGSATDPNTGPLLLLLAAYWPSPRQGVSRRVRR